MTGDEKLLRLDFLGWSPVRDLVLRPWFPVALQVLALVAVGMLALLGWGHGLDKSAAELKLFRMTHLTTLAVWGLWWPGMIAVALAFGRAWCTVCPMELANRIGDAMARRLGWPRTRMGRFLRAGWATLVIYTVLQLLVAGFSLHRVPHFTALMLAALFGLALVTGLVFRTPRSFCAGFCPAAALLSVYGRFTPLQLSHEKASVCADCETKDCVSSSSRYRFDKRSCSSQLRPFDRDPSDGCVLCLQCAKVCPRDNMGFGVVREGASVRRKALLRPFEAAFVMIALGFVAHEVVGEVKWLDGRFHWVPERLHAMIPGLSFGWFEALWFLFLFPLMVWAFIAAVGFAFGHRRGTRSLLLAAATGAAPVVAIAHLAKAAAKVASWAAFLPRALAEPGGAETFHLIQVGVLATPGRLVGLSLVGWMALLLTVVVGWRAWRWAQQVPSESVIAARSGMMTSVLLFSAVLMMWTLP